MREIGDSLDRFAQARPDAYALALLGSFCVRIEPHALRALRRRFLPRSSPSAELDLWHSSLVTLRGADAALLDLDVLNELRQRLATDSRRHEALALTNESFATHPPLLRHEIALNAEAVLHADLDDDAIEALFAQPIAGLRAGGEASLGVARWLLQASPRWHPRIRRAPVAWAALAASSAVLGGRPLAQGEPPASLDPALLTRVFPPDVASRQRIGVSLAARTLRFHDPEDAAAEAIEVPAMSPLLMILEAPGEAPRVIQVHRGTQVKLRRQGAVVLRSLLGDAWRLEAVPAREQAADDAPPRARSNASIAARQDNDGLVHIEIRTHGHPLVRVTARRDDVMAASSKAPDWLSRLGSDDIFERALASALGSDLIELRADDACQGIGWEDIAGLRAPLIRVPVLRAPAPARKAPPASQRYNVAIIGDVGRAGARDGLSPAEQAEWGSPSANCHVIQGHELSRLDIPSAENFAIVYVANAAVSLHDGGTGSSVLPGTELANALADLLRARDLHPELICAVLPQGFDAHMPLPRLHHSGRMVVFVDGTHPALNHFLIAFYARLLMGNALKDALGEALAIAGPTSHRICCVWGSPDDTLSLGLARRRARAREQELARSVVQFDAPGSANGYGTGNATLIARDMLAYVIPELPESRAQDEIHESGPPGNLPGTARINVVLRRDKAPGAVKLPLPRVVAPFGRMHGTMLLATGDRHLFIPVLVDGSNPEALALEFGPHLRQIGLDAPAIVGAPIIVEGQCVGLVASEWRPLVAEQTLWALPISQLRSRLNEMWRERLPDMLDAHLIWLRSDHREGTCLDLAGEDLLDADLHDANLDHANLWRTRLERARLAKTRLEGAVLSQARLDSADLRDARLVGAILTRANLTSADLELADLRRADLRRAVLKHARIRQCNLRNASLHGANLKSADARRADLRDADLTDAILRDADLSDSDLRGADLRGADLTGAKLDDANLAGAKLDPSFALELRSRAIEAARRVISDPRPRVLVCGSARGPAYDALRSILDDFGVDVSPADGAPDEPAWAQGMEAAIFFWDEDSPRSRRQSAELERVLQADVPLLPIAQSDTPLPAALADMLHLSMPEEAPSPADIETWRSAVSRLIAEATRRRAGASSWRPLAATPIFCILHAPVDESAMLQLRSALLQLGTARHEIWIDTIGSQDDTASDQHAHAAIHRSRYILPVMSARAMSSSSRVLSFWKEAEERRQRPFGKSDMAIVPIIVDDSPLNAARLPEGLEAWAKLQALRAPRGELSRQAAAQLSELLLRARRPDPA